MSKKVTLIIMVTLIFVLAGGIITGFAISYSDSKLQTKFGNKCKITETCDDMVYLDCNAAADGPAYYLDKNKEIIGTSGGLCMGGRCSGAPAEWTECREKNPLPTKKLINPFN